MSLRSLPLVAVFALALGGALVATGVRAGSPAPGQADIVEEVRYGEANGLVVEHRVFVDRSVQPDTSAAADALTGIPANGGSVTAQFELNPWKWDASAIPVPVSYNPANAPGGVNPEHWIQAAIGQWSSITPAFRFAYAGETGAGIDACDSQPSPDGINTIGFLKGLQYGVLGQTCTLSTRSGNLVEFDMELNTDANWGDGASITASQYDLPSTILHELGHAAGLAHPCEPPRLDQCTPAEKVAVMYYAIGRGQMKRTLQPDDIAALRAQYPSGALTPAPSPTQSPNPIPAFQRKFEVFTAAVAHD